MYIIKAKKFSLLLIVLMLIFLIISVILILRTSKEEIIAQDKPVFKTDQILIKVLIKSNESFASPLNIMDISERDISVSIAPKNLLEIVSLSETSFELRPGQTKTVFVNIRSVIEEKSIAHSPGAYVGSLEINSSGFIREIPIIVEIETKEVLFDLNLDMPVKAKEVLTGSYSNFQITLFNLKKMGLTNVEMNYFIKDIMGNTIITESETVVVETQAAFTKTVEIPENLNPGEYAFIAQAKYGDSTGTSTFLFRVAKPEAKSADKGGSLSGLCKTSNCWIGTVILAISASIIFILVYFHVGSYIYDKIAGLEREIEEKISTDSPEEKLEKELRYWKGKGYDTTILEEELKNPKRPKKDAKKEISAQIKKWKEQGYNTKILEEGLKKSR